MILGRSFKIVTIIRDSLTHCKSKVALETWDDLVGSLNHTSGFKRFSDLIVENLQILAQLLDWAPHNLTLIRLLILSVSVDVNCVDNFDLVTENNKGLGFSDDIIFQK